MKLRFTLLTAAITGLVLVPVAAAHVEITPEKIAAGEKARLTVEVPTERNVPTVGIEMKLPKGLVDVQLEPKPGWKEANKNGVISWSGGKIAPEKSDTFSFTAVMPNTPGKELLFPAIQHYASGSDVHWIGATESSDTPSPRVQLTGSGTTTPTTTTTTPATTTPAATIAAPASDDSGDSNTGLWIGLAIAGALLALGVGYMMRRRRPPAP